MKTQKRKSHAKSMVLVPLFKMRIETNKSKYSRKSKHRGSFENHAEA
jgi:stalled ribosome alternative rescue factor ArfA